MTLLDCPQIPLTLASVQTAAGETLSITGYLDQFTVPTLQPALLEAAEHQSHPKSGPLTLDLSCVRYVDAAGLALLSQASETVEAQSRAVVIRLRPGSQPETVFRSSALCDLLAI